MKKIKENDRKKIYDLSQSDKEELDKVKTTSEAKALLKSMRHANRMLYTVYEDEDIKNKEEGEL